MALGWSTATALFGAAIRDGSIDPLVVVSALLAAAGGLLAARPAPREPIEIGVDDAGCIVLRRVIGTGDAAEQRLRCVFAAPWLITLKSGTMWVRIWPDSLPGNLFRRFWVHLRWNPGRQPTDRTGASAPVPPG
jgi:hypothetical protein